MLQAEGWRTCCCVSNSPSLRLSLVLRTAWLKVLVPACDLSITLAPRGGSTSLLLAVSVGGAHSCWPVLSGSKLESCWDSLARNVSPESWSL